MSSYKYAEVIPVFEKADSMGHPVAKTYLQIA